jgi:triosephosphate isomerase
MSRKLVAGNWKMNLTVAEGIYLAKEVEANLLAHPVLEVKVVLSVPFTHLIALSQALEGEVALSAQDCSAQGSGSFTGEVSASMVASTGAEYVILGHSERREYHGEENALLAQKVNLALEEGLKVIYCCGEVLSEREANKQFEVVGDQVLEGLFHLEKEQMKEVVLAYEPVWAIGTGMTASSDQAQEMHAFVRDLLQKQYGEIIAENTSILYGGSCKPSNSKELFSQADVDGGLIGGSSLKVTDFMAIVQSF